jgi:hypothetical protein
MVEVVLEQLKNKCLQMEWEYELDIGGCISTITSCSPPTISLKHNRSSICLFINKQLIGTSAIQDAKVREIFSKIEQNYIKSLLQATVVKLAGIGD